MTKIKGGQILSQTTEFDIFVVDENGNIQLPTNVQYNGDGIVTATTFTNAIAAINAAKKVEKVVADADGNYVISEVPAGDVQVSINGVVQTPGDDYTMDGQTINFATAPASDDVIVAAYITFTNGQ